MENTLRIFIHGSPERPPPALHIKFVSPAGHFPNREALPIEWVDHDNRPVTFAVEFVHGTAEVDDQLGKYLVETGQAERSRLVVPGYFGSAP